MSFKLSIKLINLSLIKFNLIIVFTLTNRARRGKLLARQRRFEGTIERHTAFLAKSGGNQIIADVQGENRYIFIGLCRTFRDSSITVWLLKSVLLNSGISNGRLRECCCRCTEQKTSTRVPYGKPNKNLYCFLFESFERIASVRVEFGTRDGA